MRLFLRILLVCTYPFLGLSALLFPLLLFVAVFITSFTVENRTGQPLLVTPVGTRPRGIKTPLPTVVHQLLPIVSPKAGRYRLGPDESVTIRYDFDDIQFSELVLEDARGHIRQYVIDPEPMKNPFHAPLKDHYLLDDLESLPEASPTVREASVAAREERWARTVILLMLLIVPGLAYGALRALLARQDAKQRAA